MTVIDDLKRSIEFQISDAEDREEFIRRVGQKLLADLQKYPESKEKETLIEFLMDKGIFPTFAFPLDVAKFEAKGTKKKKQGSVFTESHIYAATSQDLRVALSEYSPGRRVVINKQTFLVQGVGVSRPKHPINHLEEHNLHLSHLDGMKVAEHATDWKFFHRCVSKNCGIIFQTTSPGFNLEGDVVCPGQGEEEEPHEIESTRIHTPEVFRPLIVPHRDDGRAEIGGNEENKVNASKTEMKAQEDSVEFGQRTRSSSAELPSPLTEEEDDQEVKTPIIEPGGDHFAGMGVFHLGPGLEDVLAEGTRLLVTNNGPGGKGYRVCSKCGYVELEKEYKELHQRPYAITGNEIRGYVSTLGLDQDATEETIRALENLSRRKCNGQVSKPLVFGYEFRTDVVVFRFPVKEPLTSKMDSAPFNAGLKAFREAMITAATKRLGLVEREVSGNFRKVSIMRDNQKHRYVDFFLYDAVAGGAGLVRQITSEKAYHILEEIEHILSGDRCNGGRPCQRVCTGCLLDFRNQVDQDVMNRPFAYQLFEFWKSEHAPNYMKPGRVEDQTIFTGLVSSLSDVYRQGYTFTEADHHVIRIENQAGVVRSVLPHSILLGTSTFEDNVVLWNHSTADLDEEDNPIVAMPYEFLLNMPHTVDTILFRSPEMDDEEDEDAMEPEVGG
jgi:hypothetical protein